jgi:hypothetical protein
MGRKKSSEKIKFQFSTPSFGGLGVWVHINKPFEVCLLVVLPKLIKPSI